MAVRRSRFEGSMIWYTLSAFVCDYYCVFGMWGKEIIEYALLFTKKDTQWIIIDKIPRYHNFCAIHFSLKKAEKSMIFFVNNFMLMCISNLQHWKPWTWNQKLCFPIICNALFSMCSRFSCIFELKNICFYRTGRASNFFFEWRKSFSTCSHVMRIDNNLIVFKNLWAASLQVSIWKVFNALLMLIKIFSGEQIYFFMIS